MTNVNVQSSTAILFFDGTPNNLHATRPDFNYVLFQNNNASLIQVNVTDDHAAPGLQSDTNCTIPHSSDTTSSAVPSFENVIIRENNIDTYSLILILIHI